MVNNYLIQTEDHSFYLKSQNESIVYDDLQITAVRPRLDFYMLTI